MTTFYFSLRTLLFIALLTLTGWVELLAGSPAPLPSSTDVPEVVANDPNLVTQWPSPTTARAFMFSGATAFNQPIGEWKTTAGAKRTASRFLRQKAGSTKYWSK